MRIGIDIDNVISNFNEELLKEYINIDVNKVYADLFKKLGE